MPVESKPKTEHGYEVTKCATAPWSKGQITKGNIHLDVVIAGHLNFGEIVL